MAMSLYYVSPGSGNDTTGDGTIGTPWATVQKALNTITRNATDGDQINIQSGAADTLTATLSLATYGTPTAAAPLVIRGYTSAAGDGGQGVISGAATYQVINGGGVTHWIDMRLYNSGAAKVASLSDGSRMVRCQVDTSTVATDILTMGNGCWLINCRLYDSQVTVGSLTLVYGCYFRSDGTGLVGSNSGVMFLHNLVRLTGTGGNGIWPVYPGNIINNTVDHAGTSTNAKGIVLGNSAGRGHQVVMNNLITNFSGSGAIGISDLYNAPILVANNAFYNNTTNYSLATAAIEQFGDISLSSSPYVDRANEDYRITDSLLLQTGWPQTIAGKAHRPDVGAYEAAIYRRVARILGG
jgi:hypothetical protein